MERGVLPSVPHRDLDLDTSLAISGSKTLVVQKRTGGRRLSPRPATAGSSPPAPLHPAGSLCLLAAHKMTHSHAAAIKAVHKTWLLRRFFGGERSGLGWKTLLLRLHQRQGLFFLLCGLSVCASLHLLGSADNCRKNWKQGQQHRPGTLSPACVQVSGEKAELTSLEALRWRSRACWKGFYSWTWRGTSTWVRAGLAPDSAGAGSLLQALLLSCSRGLDTKHRPTLPTQHGGVSRPGT